MSYKRCSNCLVFMLLLIFMLFLQTASAQGTTQSAKVKAQLEKFREAHPGLDGLLEQRKKQWDDQLVVMVSKNDSLVYQKQTGDLNMNSQEPIGFASSWLTAALVMTFVDQGKISLDDPVSRYLPIFSKYAKGYLTIRHCLANTTGLEAEKGGIQKFFQKNKFATLEDEVNSFASSREIVNNPGEAFSYNNIGTNIAGRVLEIVGKKSFDRLMMERIFRPLGMKKSSFTSEAAVNPASGAVSTPADYLKFLAMLLDTGTVTGKKILSAEAIKEMKKVQTGEAKLGFVPKATEGFAYGLGNWIQSQDDKGNSAVISSPGLYGGWPYVDMENKYACIIFVKHQGKEDNKEAYLAIINEVGNNFKP